MPGPSPQQHSIAALACVVMWSSAGLVSKFAFDRCPPLTFTAARFFVAGTLLLAACLLVGKRLPQTRAAWGQIAITGIVTNALYMGIGSLGLQSISVGLAAVLAATSPLLLALAGALFFNEPVRPRTLAGLGFGFGGVLLVMWARIDADNRPEGIALSLVGTLIMVTGNVLFKRWAQTCDLLASHAIQMLAGAIVLAVPAYYFENFAAVRIDATLLGDMAFLIVVVSYGAMVLWLYLLRHGAAVHAGAFLFLLPVLGVGLGALFRHEPLTAADGLGALVVAAGIWIARVPDQPA